MPSPPQNRAGYLPSLDGWRAIAIGLVLLVHEPVLHFRGRSLATFQSFGSLGVVLFFALSGVLICTRILEEERLTGSFHLKRFYIRRICRIQPAAFTYLAVIAALTLAGVLHQQWKFWFGGVFLYENFLYHDEATNTMYGFFTGHFWTLAVEEHFYLLISLALFFIRRRRILLFASALVLVKIGQKIGTHYVAEPLLRRTYWQIHVLLWPTLGAILLQRPQLRKWAQRWLQPGAVLAVSGVMAAIAFHRSAGTASNVLGWLFAVWVIATMLHPKSWTTRLLELPLLRFIGRISYSLYLWHVLFYRIVSPTRIDSRWLLLLSQRPWKYVCTLAVATASFYLIEKPMVRLGHRLAPPVTPGHRDLGVATSSDVAAQSA